MTFSLSMNVVFITGLMLCLFLYYMEIRPLNKEVRGPSFIRVFIKVASVFYFVGIFSIIIFNILYPKNYLNTEDRGYDYIIVFGAGINENKNEIMDGRIEQAVLYSKLYPKCRFVLTGAKGGNETIEEAIYMRNFMVDKGIDDRKIIIEPFAINTFENVYNSLVLIKKDVMRRNYRENVITRPFKNIDDYFDLDFLNIGFMSSEFHLTRINMMAKKYGIHKPYDIACETNILYKPYLYVREDLSLFKALVLNQLKL